MEITPWLWLYCDHCSIWLQCKITRPEKDAVVLSSLSPRSISSRLFLNGTGPWSVSNLPNEKLIDCSRHDEIILHKLLQVDYKPSLSACHIHFSTSLQLCNLKMSWDNIGGKTPICLVNAANLWENMQPIVLRMTNSDASVAVSCIWVW